MLTATDTCDPAPPIVFEERELPVGASAADCADNRLLERTWTATDACGNAASHVQLVTVIDDVDPVLLNTPGDMTVPCHAVPDPPFVAVNDNCDPDPVVAFDEV